MPLLRPVRPAFAIRLPGDRVADELIQHALARLCIDRYADQPEVKSSSRMVGASLTAQGRNLRSKTKDDLADVRRVRIDPR